MKPGLLVCTVLAGLIPMTALADMVVTRDRVVRGVKVRTAPNGDSDAEAILRPGETATLISSIPRWYQVKLDNDVEGFISKSLTRRISDTASGPLRARESDELRIHYLPIGAGTCTVVECPGQSAPPMIVDCGSSGRGPDDLDGAAARARLTEILAGRTPNLVLSHGDEDHYDLIPAVLEGVVVNYIWQGGAPNDYNQDLRDFLVLQENDGATLHQNLARHFNNSELPLSDTELDCGDAAVFILTVNTGQSKNARSLVLSLNYGDFVAMLTGDAEGSTESRSITNFHGATKATVLAGSHHGAATHGSNGFGSEWPAATEPEVVIYSSGLRHGHPRCNATTKYHDHLAHVPSHPMQCGVGNEYAPYYTRRAEYATEVNGTIVVTTDGTTPMALWCDRGVGCETSIPF